MQRLVVRNERMGMEKPTEFDCLLNRMEHAGQQETPADHHYGTHRASLLRHVRALETDAERYRKLVASGSFSPAVIGKGRGMTLNGKHSKEALDAAVDDMPAVGAA